MMSIVSIFHILIGLVIAETPVFLLILHMSNRVVKLETQIELLIKRIEK
jgi:hypothetical protein